MSLSYFTVI